MLIYNLHWIKLNVKFLSVALIGIPEAALGALAFLGLRAVIPDPGGGPRPWASAVISL